MQFVSYQEGERLTVALNGELDHHSAKTYLQTVIAKLEAYNPKVCVLDFQEVTFMDSSGIAVVINALRYMSKSGGELLLAGIGKQPMRVFRASGIDKIVKIMEEVS